MDTLLDVVRIARYTTLALYGALLAGFLLLGLGEAKRHENLWGLVREYFCEYHVFPWFVIQALLFVELALLFIDRIAGLACPICEVVVLTAIFVLQFWLWLPTALEKLRRK